MKIVEVLRRLAINSSTTAGRLDEVVAGLDNQSRLFNEKLSQLVQGSDNQARLLNEKLLQLVQGVNNQSSLLNEKLEELIEGMVNQSRLINDKMLAVIQRQQAQIELQKMEIQALRGLAGDKAAPSDFSSVQLPPVLDTPIGVTRKVNRADSKLSFESAVAQLPLMIDAKTFNTSHPDYDARLVRNFPGRIFNFDKPSKNSVYAEVKRLANGIEVPDQAWTPILDEMLQEAKTIPHADQVFERRAYIEDYMKEINRKYGAHYAAGWVNLDDALFLYWLVRRLKPRVIVQTGVCNGLSSAFMMLGLVKNGPEGTLHVIDLPPVFDSKDPAWTVKGKVYGVVIPEGKSSGWIVPDAYRDRFEVWNGDAKAMLPKMVDKVDTIDLFYHDSDHTYDHMMFEFREAKRKLRPGGLIVGDDVSWNASVWDFADEHGVPSYNFKGAVGVAFF